MTARGFHRGHEMIFVEDDDHEHGGVWVYEADGVAVADDPDRPCGFCKSPNRADGHDACLGKLPGVTNACCGHGDVKRAYVQFQHRLAFYREEALDIIASKKGIIP